MATTFYGCGAALVLAAGYVIEPSVYRLIISASSSSVGGRGPAQSSTSSSSSRLPVLLATASSVSTLLFMKYLPLRRTPPMVLQAPRPESGGSWLDSLLDIIGGHLRVEFGSEAYHHQLNWDRSIFHGRPFVQRMLSLWLTNITGKDDLIHILITNQLNYQKNFSYKILENIIGVGLVSIQDEDVHSRERKEVSPAFSPAALKSIANSTVREHSAILVKQLKNVAAQEKPVTTVRELLNRTTMNVITQAAFHSDGEMTEKLAQDFHLVVENAGGNGRFIPAFNLLFYEKNKIAAGARARLVKFTGEITDSVKEQHKQENAKVKQGNRELEKNAKSLIDFLIDNEKFTQQQLLDHSMTFLFAGFETSSNTMQWAMYLLAKNPSAQEELYEELSSVVGKDTFCEVDDLKGCSFLMNCIKETLRLYPPAASLARTAVADDVLPSGTFIPKGAFVVPNFFLLHRNTAIWGEDADEFKPNRWDFSGSSDAAAGSGNNDGEAFRQREEQQSLLEDAWMPFSVGKRNCIVKDFAINEIALLMCAVFRNVKVTLPVGEPDPERAFILTLKSKSPVNFRIEIREE